ncbi:ion transporter [Neptunomonas qingdaonensis]|uniref:Voltage-gated sodium channel n=1 Tax=Neptunomonas qingdaonensis TaxID=1045558 RepID=A0A1I2RJ15_9GAMM|nr:ion transporter [Neptunomonas qingdaonensis]SFG37766.1 voltage-gated sodium channel [Neptunomonas qingdaonensis]
MNTDNLQSRFYTLRHNRFFEIFVIAVIVFSALVIGAKTYEIPENILTLIGWMDIGITLFFLVEVSVRFMGEPIKRNFFKNAWNVFDTLIVVVSLIPIEDSELALVGRLIRIFRVLRMVSIVPELRLLLNSLFKALPQLGYVILLMFIIFYIYAAVGTSFFVSINPTLWGDISIAMLTLFRVMTFEDWTDVMYETMAVYPFSWIYYLTFIFLTTFAFLNMVIGIVVNVMEEEHAQEAKEQAMANGEPTIQDLSNQIAELKEMLKSRAKSYNQEL